MSVAEMGGGAGLLSRSMRFNEPLTSRFALWRINLNRLYWIAVLFACTNFDRSLIPGGAGPISAGDPSCTRLAAVGRPHYGGQTASEM